MTYRTAVCQGEMSWLCCDAEQDSPLGVGVSRALHGQEFFAGQMNTQGQADNSRDVPGSRVPGRDCEVVLRRGAGFVPSSCAAAQGQIPVLLVRQMDG